MESEISVYRLDASNESSKIYKGCLKMGGTDPAGHEINVTNRYLTYDGKPWLPVMGEIHFSRCSEEFWEESILKMKACKVNIIATYLFWIHHEESEDRFEWSGNRNLSHFIRLCAENGLFVFLRIGPWSHGECRNGGFPDWLYSKCTPRTNDPAYLQYVERYYSQVRDQIKGLLFKDGGPVIGIQFDNELTDNEEHLMTLKTMALKLGMEVPIYTATGWGGEGNARIPQDEMIPMFGGYPEAPWEQHVDEPKPSMHYFFYHTRNDAQIGGDLYKETHRGQCIDTIDVSRYPYATCELGGGVQVTDHRRPIIKGDDIGAISLTKLGNGNNLPGYYMFHGGSNPIGRLSTMNENKESGYPSELPVISYDFQAPIGEFGQVNDSYRRLKIFNIFLNDFGSLLAPMASVLPERQPLSMTDSDTLRFAARIKENSGFIFINNYQRHLKMKDIQDIQIELQLKEETLVIPSDCLTVKQGEYFILPFNFSIGRTLLKFSTTQLLSSIYHKGEHYLFFYAPEGVPLMYAFSQRGIKAVCENNLHIHHSDSDLFITGINPGIDSTFSISDDEGNRTHIVTLTEKQALSFYKGHAWGCERVFITDSEMIFGKDYVQLYGRNPSFTFAVFPDAPESIGCEPDFYESSSSELFSKYTFNLKGVNPDAGVRISRSCETLVNQTEEQQGCLSYGIEIPDGAIERFNDIYLNINYVGDHAQARIDEKLVSDDFYKGTPWVIGLKRLRQRLEGSRLVLDIYPLFRDKKVYLEKWPDFDGDYAACLHSLEICPEYKIRFNY